VSSYFKSSWNTETRTIGTDVEKEDLHGKHNEKENYQEEIERRKSMLPQ
jgi:hypothetical protein